MDKNTSGRGWVLVHSDKKDTRNRSESTHSYLTASSKPLTTNKKIMHLRLNGLLLSIVIWMESCLIGTNTTSSYI